MKKIITTLFIGCFLFSFNPLYAISSCENEKSQYEDIKAQYEDIKTKINNLYDTIVERFKGTWATTYALYATYNKERGDLLREGARIENDLNNKADAYNTCTNTLKTTSTNLFNDWYDAYARWDYLTAIDKYKAYIEIFPNESSARGNLVLSLNNQGDAYFAKKDYNSAIRYYNEALSYDNRNQKSLLYLWIMYYNLKDYPNAKTYLQKAYDIATDSNIIKNIKEMLEYISSTEKTAELLKNAPTNDTYSWLQYYLKELNIVNAWTKVKNTNQVIVAVIDDGININHPDLARSIWINPNAKYGSNNIIDFVWDGMPANMPVGGHGTTIAGIIWATQNNGEWIAGIAKSVQMMPLRVFDTKWWASEDSIIKAINYAIDNGANIINLSLWWSQFAYSSKSDSVIKKAYDKWIVIVIAAWNGDVLSWQQNWVNLDNNPISPICNNGWFNKYSIWVYSWDKDGRTRWTNYWTCAPFMAPGENIVSTSLVSYTNDSPVAWTSFSAPIISWIIALGYNQYGYIVPDMVYDSLQESKVKNSNWMNIIDASKYIDILGQKVSAKQKVEGDAKAKLANETRLKTPVDKWFSKVQIKYGNISDVNEKKRKYENLRDALYKYRGKLTGDKQFILEYLISLVNKEIGGGGDLNLWDLF